MKIINLLSAIFALVMVVLPVNAASPLTDAEQIQQIMAAQEKAWNRGDLEAFMQGYWQSEDLAFVGKSGLKKGWQTTLDNYKKSYPNKSAMGILKFTLLDSQVSGDSAFVLGKWHLTRDKDTPNGHFTLYWKKINDDWKIVIDHSS